MRPSRPLIALLAVLTCPLWLMTGCKDKGTAANGGTEGEAGQSLPTPEGANRGGVTGMPDRPGPGQIGLPEVDPNAPPALDENGNPIAPVAPTDPAALPVDGTLPITTPIDPNTPPATPAEPSAEDAVAVVRDYYAAINGKSFERAYALWSDGGRASGQTPQQFADGFAETAGVSVEVMPPGRVDAGAGQRYIEVPVAITSTQRDGSQHKFVGAYTLRRTVVDGASDAQRAWRIGSADIREVKP